MNFCQKKGRLANLPNILSLHTKSLYGHTDSFIGSHLLCVYHKSTWTYLETFGIISENEKIKQEKIFCDTFLNIFRPIIVKEKFAFKIHFKKGYSYEKNINQSHLPRPHIPFWCLAFAACSKKDLCAYDTRPWTSVTNFHMFFCFEEDGIVYTRAYYGEEFLRERDCTCEIKENRIIVCTEEGGKTTIDYEYVDGKLILAADGEKLEPLNFDSN